VNYVTSPSNNAFEMNNKWFQFFATICMWLEIHIIRSICHEACCLAWHVKDSRSFQSRVYATPSLDLELTSMIQFENQLMLCSFNFSFQVHIHGHRNLRIFMKQFNPTFLVHHPNNQFWFVTKMETQKQTITFHLQMYLYIQHTYNLWM
jgi:hypothetical protein